MYVEIKWLKWLKKLFKDKLKPFEKKRFACLCNSWKGLLLWITSKKHKIISLIEAVEIIKKRITRAWRLLITAQKVIVLMNLLLI